MTTAQKNAARPGRVKAASTTTSSRNHSTQPERIVIVEKDAFEEIRIGVTEFLGKSYCDVRMYSNHAGRRVPTKKGITVPLALLPALIEGLNKAQDAVDRVTQG